MTQEEFKRITSGAVTSVDSPVSSAYDDITGVTTAENIEKAQMEALGQAQQFQKEQYGQAKGLLSPYMQRGSQDFNKFRGNILSGAYTPDSFDAGDTGLRAFTYGQGAGQVPPQLMQYSGQPVSEIGYEGRQPDAFSYGGQGQQGQLDYAGSPVNRSIESYMKDDPSLAWQQEQMEKMIERRAAAKGGFGGGGIEREMLRETAGLLSQDYGNRFARAAQERGADVMAEKDMYGRALTGLNLQNLAEQSQYGRELGEYGLDVTREQDAYGRAVTGADFARAGEQERYGRARRGYDDAVSREQSIYDRALMSNQLANALQTDRYNRRLTGYGLENERLQNQMSQMQGLAKMGPEMAMALGNMAIGQGGAMSDLAIQQGNAAAAAAAAKGTPLSNLLNLAKSGADIYSSTQGVP